MFCPMQLLHSFDDQAPCSRPFNFGAHLVQEIGQVADFRLRGRAFDHGCSFGEDSGHHHIIGTEDGRTKLPAQIDDSAVQFGRENFDVASLHPHRRPESFESFQVQIDRSIANDAAAWQGNGRLLAPA